MRKALLINCQPQIIDSLFAIAIVLLNFTESIVDFNPEEGDSILLDKDVFSVGEVITMKNVSRKKKAKQASKSGVDFVYDNKKGLLYFNQDSMEKGWGDGGLFAKLQGAPELGAEDFTIV